MTNTLIAPPRRPAAATLYLDHAIRPGTPNARVVDLTMHGQIRLGRWAPFEATETLAAARCMVWEAKTKLFGLPVSGFDRVDQGYGQSAWKVFGQIPIAFARGKDVSRSAIGRMAAESVWNPSLLLGDNVTWKEVDERTARFEITLWGQRTEVTLGLLPSGQVLRIEFMRWGNPEGLPFGLYPFGGYVDEEATFEGFTIPSRLRLGWHVGSERFEVGGESFRATVDSATYR